MESVERYWCERDGAFTLDDRGYLADTGSALSPNRNLIPTFSLIDEPRLVLLGEPGAGKTTALHQVVALTKANAANRQDSHVLAVDLAEYGDEDRLVREVLRGPTVTTWKEGSGILHVFLDSLDECRLDVPKVATILAREFKSWPLDRLRFRVACRTADWPATVEDALKSQAPRPKIVEILPLQRGDVTAIASAHFIDAEAFARGVEAAGAVSLAIKPLTLGMLIDIFKTSEGSIPTSLVDLYRQGLELLAEEQNPHRRDAGHLGTLTPFQRLAIAGRIGALSIFCGKSGIDVAPSGSAHKKTTMLRLDDCTGGFEPTQTGHLQVERSGVDEVLRTGLFTSRGQQRLGWAHQSYGDYLTAWHLQANELPMIKVQELLTSNITGTTRVFPAYRQVAAWLVAMRPARYGTLVDLDADAFLSAGIPLGDRALSESLIGRLFGGGEASTRRGWRQRYRHLAHPGLVDQLRRRLSSPEVEDRILAIDIAADLGEGSLSDLLLTMLTDPDEELRVRIHAGWTIARLHPTAGDVHKLRELALNYVTDDQSDELKGLALRLLWPSHISLNELLDALTPPRRLNFFGAYKNFLTIELPPSLQPTQVYKLLDWLTRIEQTGRPDAFEPLADRIVELAWDQINQPEVARALARLTVCRAKKNEDLLVERRYNADGITLDPSAWRRRRLLNAIFAEVDDDPEIAHVVLDVGLESHRGQKLVAVDDLSWLIARHDDENEPPRPALLAQIVNFIFRPDHAPHAAVVLALPEIHPVRNALAYWFEAVELGSERAAVMRKAWLRHQAVRLESGPPAPSQTEIETEITSQLDAFEAGDNDGFWRAQRYVAVDPGQRLVRKWEPDLTALPRWSLLPVDIQRRFVEASFKYLTRARCDPHAWLGTDRFPYKVLAGFRALALLWRAAPDQCLQVPDHVWGEWAPIILAYPAGSDGETKAELIRHAAVHARRQLLGAAGAILEAATREDEPLLSIDDELDVMWGRDVALELISYLRRADVSDGFWHEIAEILARHRYEPALQLLSESLSPEGRSANSRRAFSAGSLIFEYGPPETWPSLWEVMRADPTFGKQLMLSVARRSRMTKSALALGIEERAELLIWLLENFPASEDPHFDDAHWVGPREQLADWRNSLLNTIRDDGTPQALDALRKIDKRFPKMNFDYLRRIAEEATLDRFWEPLAPPVLRRLVAEHNARAIRDAAQLKDVVLEALDHIQDRLQGETPESHYLWDEVVMRPKPEAALSDYLRNSLDQLLRERGIILNREVQIRRVSPQGIGESIDIRIDAVTKTESDAVEIATVILEVKGCWNGKVTRDIEDQLWQRYMKGLTAEGLYVVGWFGVEDWKVDGDERGNKVARLDPDELRDQLVGAAKKLADEGARIEVYLLDASYRPGRAFHSR